MLVASAAASAPGLPALGRQRGEVAGLADVLDDGSVHQLTAVEPGARFVMALIRCPGRLLGRRPQASTSGRPSSVTSVVTPRSRSTVGAMSMLPDGSSETMPRRKLGPPATRTQRSSWGLPEPCVPRPGAPSALSAKPAKPLAVRVESHRKGGRCRRPAAPPIPEDRPGAARAPPLRLPSDQGAGPRLRDEPAGQPFEHARIGIPDVEQGRSAVRRHGHASGASPGGKPASRTTSSSWIRRATVEYP